MKGCQGIPRGTRGLQRALCPWKEAREDTVQEAAMHTCSTVLVRVGVVGVDFTIHTAYN